MSIRKLKILVGVSVSLWALALITHVICSPVLSSCGLTLFLGKACFFAVPLVWLVALVMPRLNRSL